MKKLSILGALVTAMLLGSCTNDDATTNEGEILKGINVTIEQADFFAQSRATYEVDPARGFVSSWSEGDVIGIYPIGGDQVAFPISDNTGSSTARFDGGSWALRSNYKYSAYYPFSKSNYTVSETEIPVNYTGQAQSGNNSTTGLAAYDFLAAAATQPNSSGSVDLIMKHLGAFVRFQLTMPKAATLLNAYVASDGTEFVTSGTVDLSAATPAITSKSTASNFDIALTNITCTEGEVVTLYAMVAPVNLSDSKMTITLSDDANKTYIYECNGTNFAAGKSYNFTIPECIIAEASDDIGSIIDANGHEYVDLALPSGTKWATCNIGGRYSEDNGDYFAWGETDIKTSYTDEGYLGLKDSQEMGTAKDPLYGYSNIAGTQYDVAHMRWGGSWKLPTTDQFDELIDPNNCKIERITMNGRFGYRFTSVRNGNSIFLSDEVGYRYGNEKSGITTVNGTYYMSANNYSTNKYMASMLRLRTDVKPQVQVNYSQRYYGYPVRPVITTKETSGGTGATIEKHEYMDLALPSETKWATCNIGARYPEDNGDYFAWGETDIKTSYTGEGYLGLKDSQEMGTTKDPLYGYSNIAGTQYDVAHMKWGGSWKLPTTDQFDELIDPNNCKIERITMNGKFGYRFTSVRNGNSIFLSDEVGYRTGGGSSGGVITAVNGTYYMSANNYSTNKNMASMLLLRKDVKPQVQVNYSHRYIGYPVRPVFVE